jgi:hypothetical protein
MKYQLWTAVNVIEADSRLEAVEKFLNSTVVILLEEMVQEGERKRGHEFIRKLKAEVPDAS